MSFDVSLADFKELPKLSKGEKITCFICGKDRFVIYYEGDHYQMHCITKTVSDISNFTCTGAYYTKRIDE